MSRAVDETLGIIIQARTGSTRMPNKIVQAFYQNYSILEIQIERLKELGVKIIVATTDNANDDIIEELSDKQKVSVFRGPEEDVLKRFIQAAEKFKLSHIVRVCSDNPFIDTGLLDELLEDRKYLNMDYLSYSVNGVPAIKTHYGFFSEVVALQALRKIEQQTAEKLYREHVTNYIYINPEIFKIEFREVSVEISQHRNIRLTIDTFEDFTLARTIYAQLIKQTKGNDVTSLLNLIKNNPQWEVSMVEQIDKNTK